MRASGDRLFSSFLQLTVARCLISASILCWTVSLGFPALVVGGQVQSSVSLLALGWLGPFAGGYWGWFSNPMIFIIAFGILFGIRRSLLWLFAIPLFALFVGNALSGSLPANEAGGGSPIQAHRLGWYLWMLSQALLLGALAFESRDRRAPPPTAEAV